MITLIFLHYSHFVQLDCASFDFHIVFVRKIIFYHIKFVFENTLLFPFIVDPFDDDDDADDDDATQCDVKSRVK